MTGHKKRENTTIKEKIALRKIVRGRLRSPVVMETHGGMGRIYKEVYSDLKTGVVFETDSKKASFLALQRPSWSVWNSDCVAALESGVGNHLKVNLLDVDPHGDPWPAIDAFLFSDRTLAPSFWIVVHDGIRLKTRYGNSWNTGSLHEAVAFFGNDLFDIYLETCKWMLQKRAAKLKRELRHFAGYYCGHQKNMTHYAAYFTRPRRRRVSKGKASK